MSYRSAINVLVSMGFHARRKKKQPLLTNNHRKQRLAWAKKYQNWSIQQWHQVVFSDETKINIWGSDGCRYYWTQPGDVLRPHHIDLSVKHGGGKLMMWGCITSEGPGYACQVYDGTMDSLVYQHILGTTYMETLKYYGMNKGTIYLQQDNDPKHKSKSTMTWLQQNKVRYINDWPPNSPDLNPIQHVWHLLKLRLSLYERKARNIDELWERVDVEWNKLDKDVCRSYIDSMPDRIAAVTLYRHGLDVVVPIFSPSVCLLASGSWRYPYGCVYDDVDQMAEPLHQSSLESNRQSTEQDLARTITSGDPGGSLLAQRDLVSPVEIFGNGSSSVPQQERYTCDDSINPSPSPQELEALRLAIISNKYSKNGLNDNATQDLLQPLLEPTATNRGYRKNQLRFLAWATAHNVFPTMFTGADVVNFLARLKHDHKLQLGTLKSIRTAIAHLHVDSRSISSHPLINTYLDSIAKQAPPVSIHKPQVDLTPSMVYARSIPSCFSTSVSLLQQKLAFLLAMAAFLRPSDLARIPFDSCKITPSDGCLNFKVVSPKERRKKRTMPCFLLHGSQGPPSVTRTYKTFRSICQG
ncbi:hypothetical protein G6F64_012275 [Rhizopus arrhizus]|uniref:Tc1-like transposase DDE domain-containing protein n=1 Tax=Rhizopus oryzae TaxID=64495 RepID=A0A9P7BLD7_RHIOR|nr:hypothetical protein G6F64_012275 [Rhizopus arrhizus]